MFGGGRGGARSFCSFLYFSIENGEFAPFSCILRRNGRTNGSDIATLSTSPALKKYSDAGKIVLYNSQAMPRLIVNYGLFVTDCLWLQGEGLAGDDAELYGCQGEHCCGQVCEISGDGRGCGLHRRCGAVRGDRPEVMTGYNQSLPTTAAITP